MESSSSDNDSFMKVDDSILFEEYNELLWHDNDCGKLFKIPNGTAGSRLCIAC